MRSKFRFSLFGLLFLAAIIAGYFAGLDRGFDAGLKEWRSETKYTDVHHVGELLAYRQRQDANATSAAIAPARFDTLIGEIRTNVLPHAWANDPDSTIVPFRPSLKVIVTGNATLHRETKSYLQKKTEDARKQIELEIARSDG